MTKPSERMLSVLSSERRRETEHVHVHHAREHALARQHEQPETDEREREFHADLRTENRDRRQRRGPQALEDATLPVNGDDRDERLHTPEGDEERGQDRDVEGHGGRRLQRPDGRRARIRPRTRNRTTGKPIVPTNPIGSRTKTFVSTQVSFQNPFSIGQSLMVWPVSFRKTSSSVGNSVRNPRTCRPSRAIR